MHHGPTLEVDLGAITRNYERLRGQLKNRRCAGVVKANAYGLGVAEVAPALYRAGCRDFFVATLQGGVFLRKILGKDAVIYIFHGVRAGQSKDFTAHTLVPVLNSLEQLSIWQEKGPYALHIDTGMRRLGLTVEETRNLRQSPNLKLVMSHLACAGEPEHPMNREQLAEFSRVREPFKGIPASLSNSSGIFLGKDYHFDLARPGCSLYGISPNTHLANPVENVVTLSAPVLQYRTLTKPESVGYGATATAPAGSILATVELGYADGFLRSLSNRATAYAGTTPVPLIGRVSMDMVSIDVTKLPAHLRTSDLRITFIGKELPVDKVATNASTIGYEIFTRLGSRVKRIYS